MKLKDIFSFIPPKPPVHGKKEKRALCRKAASLAATGNILVQCGFFATKEDLDERKKRLLFDEK
ncbi:MAG: hypothetical protein V1782_08695 [Pseudomonadota bacterium]